MSECNNCDKYDYKTHSCPIFCDVIRNTLEDVRADEKAKTIEEFAQNLKLKTHMEHRLIDILAEQMKEVRND